MRPAPERDEQTGGNAPEPEVPGPYARVLASPRRLITLALVVAFLLILSASIRRVRQRRAHSQTAVGAVPNPPSQP